MHNIHKQTYSLTAILRYLHHRYFIYITPLVMIIIPNKLYCFGGMRLETYFFDKFSGAVSPEADGIEGLTLQPPHATERQRP